LRGDLVAGSMTEPIMLDWILENPSTPSEASGRSVRDWNLFLRPSRFPEQVPGVKCLGFSPLLQYRYVQPVTSASNYFSRFLDDRRRVLAAVPPPSSDVVCSEFVPPDISDLYKHLAGFGSVRPDGTSISNSTYVALLREVSTLESWGPVLTDWMSPAVLAELKVPGHTSPGIRWKRLGYKNKREALMPALVEATRTLGRIRDSGEVYVVPPAGVAGRGKRVGLTVDRSAPDRKEGRLIVMPDLEHHLLASMASSPYMGHLRSVPKENGGVLLGMGPFSGNYQQIANWAQGASYFLFLDFSKFDQSIPALLLKHVMKHISSRFEKEPGFVPYWQAQYENLVHTRVAMPDGQVYRKPRGVASGDPWTSLADSYANWIALLHASHLLGRKVKVWTFGDDSIVAVYDRPRPAVNELELWKDALYGSFGLSVSAEKSYVSTVLVDIDEDPEPKKSGSFLSMYFLQTPWGVRPTRSIQDLYELFLVPERNRGTLRWEIVRTSMAYLVFYWNDTARYVLEEYWDWLHKTHSVPELYGTMEDFTLLREMDIPWSSFKVEWLNHLPTPAEAELMYQYGHTGFFPPALWALAYRSCTDPVLGNRVLMRMPWVGVG